MIWLGATEDHMMAIHPLVRRWLRLGPLSKFFITALIALPTGAILAFIGELLYEIIPVGPYEPPLTSFLIIEAGFFVFWLAEVIMDVVFTHFDIKKYADGAILFTRGEYIGGHPSLPHGRFVYLILGGMRENPELRIVLPQYNSPEWQAFPIPLLDLQEATERRELSTGDLAMGADGSLANVNFRNKFLGQQAFLNVNYTGPAGRKHVVEFANFLWGDDEIQKWRNHIVCCQAEADTGKAPYGPWKSLPKEDGQGAEAKEGQVGEALMTPSPEESDRIVG